MGQGFNSYAGLPEGKEKGVLAGHRPYPPDLGGLDAKIATLRRTQLRPFTSYKY